MARLRRQLEKDDSPIAVQVCRLEFKEAPPELRNLVQLQFSRPVLDMVMPPDQAIKVGEALVRKAKECLAARGATAEPEKVDDCPKCGKPCIAKNQAGFSLCADCDKAVSATQRRCANCDEVFEADPPDEVLCLGCRAPKDDGKSSVIQFPGK